MIKNKFCIVGIDRDFEEFIIENKGNYLGLISDYKKNYKITKRAGKEKITDWLKIKKKYNLFKKIEEWEIYKKAD